MKKSKSVDLGTDAHLEKYMGLIVSWAKRYVGYGICDFDDARQECFMVYLNSCKNYDNKKAKFSTYLNKSLQHNMYRMLREAGKNIPTLSLDAFLGNDEDGVSLLDAIPSPVEFKFVPDTPIVKLRCAGYTMQQIADEMGVSRPTVYKRLRKEQKKYKRGDYLEKDYR